MLHWLKNFLYANDKKWLGGSKMGYYNYHGIAKKLIFEGQLQGYEFFEDYHGIKPALVFQPFLCRFHVNFQYIKRNNKNQNYRKIYELKI